MLHIYLIDGFVDVRWEGSPKETLVEHVRKAKKQKVKKTVSLGMRAQSGCLVLVHLTRISHSERGHHLILMAIRSQSSEI